MVPKAINLQIWGWFTSQKKMILGTAHDYGVYHMTDYVTMAFRDFYNTNDTVSLKKTLIDQLTTWIPWIIQLKCWVFGGVHLHFNLSCLWDTHWSPFARYARMLDEPDERLFPGRIFFGDS